jgi:hypothetical protein
MCMEETLSQTARRFCWRAKFLQLLGCELLFVSMHELSCGAHHSATGVIPFVSC